MLLPKWGPKPIQIIFGGSGGLMSYFLGIAKHLQDTYPKVRSKEPVYSAVSGGSIPALLLAYNYPIDRFHDQYVLKMWETLDQSWTGSIGNLHSEAMPLFNRFLNQNKLDPTDLNGKYYLRANRIHYDESTLLPSFEPVILSDWRTHADLLHGLQSTSNLYFLGCGLKSIGIKKEILYDGVLSGSKFDLKDWTDVPSNLRTIYIHTHLITEYSWLEHWPWTDVGWHEKLFQKGLKDGETISEFELLL